MGLRSFLSRQFTRAIAQPAPSTPRRQPQPGPNAILDAAQYDEFDYKFWANADRSSPNQYASAPIRDIIRQRARLEVDNSPSVSDLVEGFVHDFLGTGPRPQIVIPGFGSDVTRFIERAFSTWAKDRRVRFYDKLRLLVENSVIAGDCIGRMVTNPKVGTPVQLDLRLYEAEQCTTPDLDQWAPNQVDGIVYDEWGNPVTYHLLGYHPSDMSSLTGFAEPEEVPADEIVHWFRARRPNQGRGLSRLQSGLPISGQIRRYAKAVLTAAEMHARMHTFLETQDPASGEPTETPEEFESFEVPNGTVTTLPKNVKAVNLPVTQPSSNHESYVASRQAEFGRTLNQPRNKATGDSSNYNYSSGRLDFLPAQSAIKVERSRFEVDVINPFIRAWLTEALLIPDYLPEGLPPLSEWIIAWRYDGFPSIDPLKDTQAAQARIDAGFSTYAREISDLTGEQWDEVFEQQALELKRREELGLPSTNAGSSPPTNEEPVEDETQLDDEELEQIEEEESDYV